MYNLCILGFGNVGRALTVLLARKADELRTRYSIDYRITGIASRRIGWLAAPDGLDVSAILAGGKPANLVPALNVREWLAAARADVMFELSSLDPLTGQPAIDYLRAALEHGAHAITANKGPIVHGYHALRDLAIKKGKHFLFESTVGGGMPVFSLFREALPATRLVRFRGLFNSTTSTILEMMETGASLEDGIKRAQELGITETDPSADIDGWDATVKVCALATVLMDYPLKPDDVEREGIRGLSGEQVRAARTEGKKYRLVASAERASASGPVVARVRPMLLEPGDPLAIVSGPALVTQFQTDIFQDGLTLIDHGGSLEATAYSVLADFIAAVK